MAQGDSEFALVNCVIIKFVVPIWLFCSVVFVKLRFVVNKKIVKKFDKVVIGCASATTPLCYFL